MSVANQDRYEKFIAVVNGGSGVIFQPMTDEYSYILTAKHTLYEDKEMKKTIQSHKLSVKNTDINFIEKYEHDDLDIAILKIKKVNIETPSKWIKDIEEKKYDFWGHPDYNRNNNVGENLDNNVGENLDNNAKDSLDNFKLTANKTESNKTIVVFDNPEFSDKNVIDGFSGGGIFTEVNDLICLIAIEFEMNALPTDRRDRRIKAVSIKAFDEIIDKNNLASLGECKLKQEKLVMVILLFILIGVLMKKYFFLEEKKLECAKGEDISLERGETKDILNNISIKLDGIMTEESCTFIINDEKKLIELDNSEDIKIKNCQYKIDIEKYSSNSCDIRFKLKGD